MKRTAKKAAKKRSKGPKKTQAETQGKRTPTLKPQPNGGALWAGPPANPVAGPGRPPNALRAIMRGNLNEVIPELHKRWVAKEIDALQYAEFLSKYAIGPLKGVGDAELDQFAKQVAEIVFQECGPELFQRVSARLAEAREKAERSE